jgi:hypothetical protein
VFDLKFFEFNYEAEHPPIEIPPEIVADVDNDWKLNGDKREEVIADYQAKLEEAAALFNPPEAPPVKGKK